MGWDPELLTVKAEQALGEKTRQIPGSEDATGPLIRWGEQARQGEKKKRNGESQIYLRKTAYHSFYDTNTN